MPIRFHQALRPGQAEEGEGEGEVKPPQCPHCRSADVRGGEVYRACDNCGCQWQHMQTGDNFILMAGRPKGDRRADRERKAKEAGK